MVAGRELRGHPKVADFYLSAVSDANVLDQTSHSVVSTGDSISWQAC